MLTLSQLQHYNDQGYLIIEHAIPDGLLEPLRAAAGRLTEKTRRGAWPYKRRAGEDDIWGVSHLLHPDVGEPVFAEYVASPVVLDVVADLLGVDTAQGTTPLQLELVNMLVNPANRDYAIGWHRDLVRVDLPPEEEHAALMKLQHGVQWNTALYDEACLHIVPASHRRPATAEEREIVLKRPTDPMPGQLAVALTAGQGVYYNANLLHRGVYSNHQRRETLHCCMGSIEGSHLRSSLYEWLAWMTQPGFRETLPERLHPLYENFVRMAEQFRRRNVEATNTESHS